jgi:hypothetical protein
MSLCSRGREIQISKVFLAESDINQPNYFFCHSWLLFIVYFGKEIILNFNLINNFLKYYL